MQRIKSQTLWHLFLATLFIQFAGGVLYFLVFDDPQIVQPIYTLTKVVMLLAPIALVYAVFRLPKFSLKKKTKKSIAFGLLSGILISAAIYGVFILFQSTFTDFAPNIAQKVEDFGILQHFLLAALGVSLIHSLFEEYFWRWYVVGGLQTRFTPTFAIAIGAALFSLHHFIILSQFFTLELTLLFGSLVGVGGVIWSLIHKKTGSLLGPWISHAIVDAMLFYLGWVLIG